MKPRFGDKSIGKNSIDRLIVVLEAHGLLKPFLIVSSLVFFTGLNAVVHDEYSKGFTFLILVSLSLLSGIKTAETFFGASSFAVFLTIHVSLFGFNQLAILVSFTIFIMFRKAIGNEHLYPVLIYLICDTMFTYFDVFSMVMDIHQLLSQRVFSVWGLTVATATPLIYMHRELDRFLINLLPKCRIAPYGAFLFPWGAMNILFACGKGFGHQIFWNLGLIFEGIYMLGLLRLDFKNDDRKTFFIASFVLAASIFIWSEIA